MNNSSEVSLFSCPGSAEGVKWNEMEASDWLRAFFSNLFGHVTCWRTYFEKRVVKDLVNWM